MTNPPPVARPGDICILLEPSESEMPHLRALQHALQKQFSGSRLTFSRIVAAGEFEILDHLQLDA